MFAAARLAISLNIASSATACAVKVSSNPARLPECTALAFSRITATDSVRSSSPNAAFAKVRAVVVLGRMADNPNSANKRSRGLACCPSVISVFLEFWAEGAPLVTGAAFFDCIVTSCVQAIYTIMLAQPDKSSADGPKGRFRDWWQVIGRPIENAAKELGIALQFGRMFLANETEDSSVTNLIDALEAMREEYPGGCSATEIANLLNNSSNQKSDQKKDRAATIREFLFPNDPVREVSAKSIGRLLRKYVGTPVLAGKTVLTLQAKPDGSTNAMAYSVHSSNAAV
jgi:hypothetical protein